MIPKIRVGKGYYDFRRAHLAAHLDAAFDALLLTIDEGGLVRLSPKLPETARALLALDRAWRQLELAPDDN